MLNFQSIQILFVICAGFIFWIVLIILHCFEKFPEDREPPEAEEDYSQEDITRPIVEEMEKRGENVPHLSSEEIDGILKHYKSD